MTKNLTIACFTSLLCATLLLEPVAQAQNWDEPAGVKKTQEARFEEPQIELAEKLRIQKQAESIAAEVAADVGRKRFSTASKTIRERVHEARTWHPDAYDCFIKELNEQLERRSVLGSLGLRQRPNAALTPQQYSAEQELYGRDGNCTLLASVLSMVRPEAIKQGKLGDCWFLSTLAVVANDYPFLIPAMITVDTDGTYLVRFPGHRSQTIRVTLPPPEEKLVGTVKLTEYGRWPEVLELAAAQLFPQQIQTGGWASQALKLLTGLDSTAWALSPTIGRPVLSASTLSETIVKALDTNEPILISTNPITATDHNPGPLPPNHVYSIVGYMPANELQGAQVAVRNPWGRLGFDPNTLPEVVPDKQGKFYLPVTTLHQYFGWVTVANNVIRPVQPRPVQADNSNNNNNNTGLPTVPTSYIRSKPAPRVPRNPLHTGLPTVPKSYIRK